MDWTELRRGEPAMALPERHAEALTRLATRLLRDARPADAAFLLRRRTRLAEPPSAAEHALLALAHALAGDPDAADAALLTALDADPLDPTVGLVALRLARDPDRALEAARRILASPLSGDEGLAKAFATLFRQGGKAAARLDLVDDRLSGWVAWTGAGAPTLVLAGPGGSARHALAAEADPGFLPPGAFAAFVSLRGDGAIAEMRLERDGVRLLRQGLVERHRGGAPMPGPHPGPPLETPARRPLRVVMPVFADPDATREALRAAILEVARHGDAGLVVVDDASPDPEIAALCDALAARGLAELRRNPRNLGFTGAVRRGLEDAGDCDVLLLNADAVLPPGALARLADAVYAAPDIGSATPLSNNGEWTSWPRLGHAAPAPDAAQAARIDAAAAALAPAPVDMPNGIGFALFVRHDGLRAAGELSAVYERGYFEDLEWTLRMRRAGFRNVAAPGVFAVHHGSRSFGSDKALLVARNLRRFRRRFPELRAESAAFRRADPLRPVRARLEAACPPEDVALLLVAPAGSALAAERLHRLGREGRAATVLEWRRSGAALLAELRRSDGAAPQSLRFDAAAQGEALVRWLAALAPTFVELAGPPPPEPLAEAIERLDAAFVILAGDLGREPAREAPLLADFEAWRGRLGERWLQVVASDRLTLAALRAHLGDGPDAARVEPALWPAEPSASLPPGAALGILMGVPLPSTLRWSRALGDALAPTDRPLVALGRSADDLALIGHGIGASGSLLANEFAAAARGAGVGALVLPPGDPSLALFDRVLAETGLPGACLDWSEAAASPGPAATLLLARTLDERQFLHAVADRFAGGLASAPPRF